MKCKQAQPLHMRNVSVHARETAREFKSRMRKKYFMRFKNKLVFIIIVTISVSLNSCYFWNSTYKTVKLRKYQNYVELELTHKTKMNGLFFNIHAGKFESKNSTTIFPELIYIKIFDSHIEGKDIIFKNFKVKSTSDLDFSTSINKGYIEFDTIAKLVNITVQRPNYNDNEISGYSAYEHNGKYKYVILTDTILTKDQLNYYPTGLPIDEYIKKFGNDFNID
jgi:hypothetical protein